MKFLGIILELDNKVLGKITYYNRKNGEIPSYQAVNKDFATIFPIKNSSEPSIKLELVRLIRKEGVFAPTRAWRVYEVGGERVYDDKRPIEFSF
jgi:hypothetical protein